MNKIFPSFLFCFLIVSTISAQKKLTYNNKGELTKSDYTDLLNTRKYQLVSAFDTVSMKPLLVYAIYIKDKKLGILDDSAKEVTPAIYDGIEGLNISYTTVMFGFHENYPVKIGKKYGLISNKGKTILPMEYDYITCEEKKSAVRKHKKDVVIDSIVVASKGNEELHFTPLGKLLKKTADNSLKTIERVEEYRDSDIPSSLSPGKLYETTSHGKIIKKLDNGFVIVEAKVENKYYYQGLVELATNKLVLPVVYNYLVIGQKNKIIAMKNNKFDLFNTKGELLLKESYDGIENFNTVYKIKKLGKTALFDLDLNQKTDFIYDSFSSAGPDFMIAKIGTKEGVIEPYGKEIVPFMYDRIEGYFNRYGSGFAFFKVIKDNKEGIISIQGKPFTEVIYDDITPECTIEEPSFHGEMTMPIDHDYDEKSNNYFIIKKDNKYGLLDNNFKQLIPNEYDKIEKSYHKDFVIVSKKNAQNRYDLSLLNIKKNTTILPYEYDDFKYLGGNYFMIYQKTQMGVCNFDGKLIIPMGPCEGFSDRYYFDVIYHGLTTISGRKSYFMIDYQDTMINMLNN